MLQFAFSFRKKRDNLLPLLCTFIDYLNLASSHANDEAQIGGEKKREISGKNVNYVDSECVYKVTNVRIHFLRVREK